MSQQVWLSVEDDDAWVLCTVTEKFGGSVGLKRLHGPPGVELELTITDEEFAELTPASGVSADEGVEDLVSLNEISAGMLLHNLRMRYAKDLIYTAIGPILVAVNPYKALDTCSAEGISSMMEADTATMPPHVFKLSKTAFAAMMKTGSAQSILISGESGAGKTETTKLCMTCLAETSGSSGKSTEAALESGILLESFGNAKTVHNNNSSRFGKWCAVHFDGQGHIGACRIRSFLLEKSRVVMQGDGERNYHVFYQLLAGHSAEEPAPFLKDLKLLAPDKYAYTCGMTSLEGVDDTQAWVETLEKLELLGYEPQQVADMFRIVASVLALGNLSFEGKEGEKLNVSDRAMLEQVASLMQVEAPSLEAALVSRKVASGRGSSYSVPLTESQCIDTRDALAKALYSRLFDWLISRLNEYMQSVSPVKIDEEDELFIGILDVFGFENFEFNSFEQLCINYTNEKLQQQFINSVVKLQQEDYKREGIEAAHISFPDNSEQITLIDSKMGVMGMLDEECALPQGSEEAYVEKMNKMFIQSAIYSKPSRAGGQKRRSVMPVSMAAAKATKNLDKLRFNITHYAGLVTYTAEAWMDKNRGFLQPELASLMTLSDNELLESLFPATESTENKKASTVFATFRTSLRQLSATLLQTSAHYIRCVKPNLKKVPGHFDGHFISKQLRYTGVAAVVEIQRCGYPISVPKPDFISRYRCCAFSDPDKIASALGVDNICKNLLAVGQALLDVPGDWVASKDVQLGKTKVFLREEVVKMLEKAREAIWDEGAIALQRAAARRYAVRVAKLVRTHKGLAATVRKALGAKAFADAEAGMASLKAEWDKAALPTTEVLQPTQRDFGELEMEVGGGAAQMEAETAALSALKAALEGGKYVEIKSQLQVAQTVSQGWAAELSGAMAKAETALADEEKKMKEAEEAAKAAKAAAASSAASSADKAKAAEAEAEARRKIEEYKKWEAEVESNAKKREAELKAKRASAQSSGPDEGMEQVVLEVKNDPRPEKGLGVSISDANTVVALIKGGMAAKEGKLRLGDVIVAVDGIPVKGKKVVSAMAESATSYKLTVERMKSETAAALHAGAESAPMVDIDGFLYMVKAKDGRAIRLPKKRWVVLQGSQLTWYTSNKGKQEDVCTQSLVGATATLPLRTNQNQMTPAMRAFAELRKFPFMLTWPNGEVEHEIVIAASTSAERAAWANALKDAIGRAKVGAPTAGWLFKEGGRMSGFSLAGWKKRWFVLVPPKPTVPAALYYYETAQSKKEKGKILLRGSDVFIPKKLRGTGSYEHCFCVTSQSVVEGGKSDKAVTTCTLLAATSADEQKKWVESLEAAVQAAGAQAPVKPAAAVAKESKAQKAVGGDAGATSVAQGTSSNMEQLKGLDIDTLLTLRVKQLKAVLEHMGVTYDECVEKKDLVAKIVKSR